MTLANYFFNDLRQLVIQRAIRKVERAELEAVMEITRTADCREGIDAFLNERGPVFRGPSYRGT